MLTAIEDNFVDRIKERFGTKIRTVESLPGDWDAELMKRIVGAAPAVYVAFHGGPGLNGDTLPGIASRWSFFAVTAHASGEPARRRGDQMQIGAYEIITHLVPMFHNYTVPDVGTLKLSSIENLYSGVIDGKGVTLYAVLFGMDMNFDQDPPLASLDDFLDVAVDFDLAPADGAAEGSTVINLPQE